MASKIISQRAACRWRRAFSHHTVGAASITGHCHRPDWIKASLPINQNSALKISTVPISSHTPALTCTILRTCVAVSSARTPKDNHRQRAVS